MLEKDNPPYMRLSPIQVWGGLNIYSTLILHIERLFLCFKSVTPKKEIYENPTLQQHKKSNFYKRSYKVPTKIPDTSFNFFSKFSLSASYRPTSTFNISSMHADAALGWAER